MLGSYNIKVNTNGMPQKVASAFTRIFDSLLGAKYGFIAYLGSKMTNGTNHAILASQTLVTGTDVHSVVLITLNEKPGDVDGSKIEVVSIEPVLSDGGKLGGLTVAPTTEIPEEAAEVFKKNFDGFLGNKVTPFALLGTQMVNGAKYVFAATSSLVLSPEVMMKHNTERVCLITVYSNYNKVEFDTIIEGAATLDAKENDPELVGYAFTWLTKKDWP